MINEPPDLKAEGSLKSLFTNRYLRIISKLFVGLLFTFSGFVKIIDPFGFAYKFTDYFIALNMGFFVPFALQLAILLSATELIIGVTLLLNIKPSLSSWFALFFMVLFTPLTLYLALTNAVTDCGCFGDAVVLDNWQTFWKNVIIDLFVFLLFINRNKMLPLINQKVDLILFLVLFSGSLYFGYHFTNRLPLIDFLPYKVGTFIPDAMIMPPDKKGDSFAYNYTMVNSKTDEKKVINSDDYIRSEIWKDSSWVITKTSEPYLVEKGYKPPIHDLRIETIENHEITGYPIGQDILDMVLADEGYTFWLVAYDLANANQEAMKYANNVAKFCKDHNYKFLCLTSTSLDEINKIRESLQPSYIFYNCDQIPLKTIIRSNPGYVLFKKGTVLGKWHYNQIPKIEDLQKVIENQSNIVFNKSGKLKNN